MPTKIAAASVCNQAGLDGSIEYSASAGRACIEQAQIADAEIGLLLNVGVYRDSNIHEPAVAAIIQGKIGLNGAARARELGHVTLCFDLMNGVCGFFNALQVAGSFLDTQSTRAVLVVASDGHPSRQPHAQFPYDRLGAAALLTSGHDGSGFSHIVYETSDDDYVGASSFTDVTQAGGARGSLELEEEPDYRERLRDFAVAKLAAYLDDHALDASSFKYVVAATPACDVALPLVKLLHFRADQLLDVAPAYGNPFSSLPIVGYHLARERGLAPGERVLLFSAGAGLSFACAVYSA